MYLDPNGFACVIRRGRYVQGRPRVPTPLPNHRNVTGRRGRQICALGIALFIVLGTAAAQSPGSVVPDPLGEWLTAKGYARIRIVDCDNRLWGVVAWEQRPGVDDKNPDRSKRGRPTLGMPILLGMQQTKRNEWSGDIYNSQDGRTYSAHISMLDPNTLKVQGCVLGFLCGGENWTRVMQQPNMNAAPAHPTGSAPRAGMPSPRAKSGAPSSRSSNIRPRAPTPPPTDTENTPPSDADVCLGIADASGLSHERGLK